MAITWPVSPSVDDEFTSGARTWVWDGDMWRPKAVPPLPPGGTTGQFLGKVSDADGDADWLVVGDSDVIGRSDYTGVLAGAGPSAGEKFDAIDALDLGGGQPGHDHYGGLIAPCAVDGTATSVTLIDSLGETIAELPVGFVVGGNVFFGDGMWTVTESGPWTPVEMNGGEFIQSTTTGESYSARNTSGVGGQIDPNQPATSIARVVDIRPVDPFDFPALSPSVPIVLSVDDDCFTGTGDTLTLVEVPGVIVRNDSLDTPVVGYGGDTLVYRGNPDYPLATTVIVIVRSGAHEGWWYLNGGTAGSTARRCTDDDSIQGVKLGRLRHNTLIKIAEGWRGQRIAVVFRGTNGDGDPIVSAREFAWLTAHDVTAPNTIELTRTHGKGDPDILGVALTGIGDFPGGSAHKVLAVNAEENAWELTEVTEGSGTSGAIAQAWRQLSAIDAVTADDGWLKTATGGGGSFGADLPPAASVNGRLFLIDSYDTDENEATVLTADGSDLIEGSSTFVVFHGGLTFLTSDGTGWRAFNLARWFSSSQLTQLDLLLSIFHDGSVSASAGLTDIEQGCARITATTSGGDVTLRMPPHVRWPIMLNRYDAANDVIIVDSDDVLQATITPSDPADWFILPTSTGWKVMPWTGGGGAVTSVDGQIGDVDLSGSYDMLGAAATVDAAKMSKAANGSDIANAASFRLNLGVVPGTDVQAYSSELAAIAALSGTTFGRGFLTLANHAALVAKLALVAADIPNLAASQITSGVFATGRLGSGTGSSSNWLRGDGAWTALAKSDVGLGNVDNTADASKPVSTAQQTAIDAKVADAINDGTTTIAPSQNAVFDALALKQPLDSDLTTIAGLTATTDNFIQSVGGAWASRTPAQVRSSLKALTPYVAAGGSTGSMSVPGQFITVANGALALVANTLYYEFFWAPFDCSVTALYAYVVSGSASSNVRIGIVECDPSTLQPSAALGESSSMASATSSTLLTYTPGTPIALSAGKLYGKSLQSDGTPTLRAVTVTADPMNAAIWGIGGGSDRVLYLPRVSRTYAALSGTPTAWDTASNSTSAPSYHRTLMRWTV